MYIGPLRNLTRKFKEKNIKYRKETLFGSNENLK